MATYQSVTKGDVIDVAPHLERARRALSAAELLLREDYLPDAVARAHQSTVHAERALLATEKRSPATAWSVHRLATNHFHQPGQVPGEHLARIEALAELRVRVDEQPAGGADGDVAARALDTARDFLADVTRFVVAAGYLEEPAQEEAS